MDLEKQSKNTENGIPKGWEQMGELDYGEMAQPDEQENEPEYDDEYDDEYEDDEEYYEYYDDEEDLRERQYELFAMDLPPEILEKYPFIAELPGGIAVMGGTARSIAREVITGEVEPIRDIDLVDILDVNGNSKTTQEMRDKLAREYMADDYSYGHGIESENFESYFNTRDFTINQSLILDGKLIVSDLAYSDFQENIVRPTDYEMNDWGEVSSRIFTKALMMQTVLSEISDSVPLLEDCEANFVQDFDVALTLNKVMSRGVETARHFTENLVERDIINRDFAEKPKALAINLLDRVWDFEFRPTDSGANKDDVDFRDMRGYWTDDTEELLAKYPVRDPGIVQEIRDSIGEETTYDDEKGVVSEPRWGKYTRKDYDEINNYPRPNS